jgi:hypothetical protein
MWWIYYRNKGNLVGVAIIEATSLYHARMKAAVCGIGRAADYSDGKEVDVEDAALVARDCIRRLLSPEEAQQLSDRVCAAKAVGALALEPVKRELLTPDVVRGAADRPGEARRCAVRERRKLVRCGKRLARWHRFRADEWGSQSRTMFVLHQRAVANASRFESWPPSSNDIVGKIEKTASLAAVIS